MNIPEKINAFIEETGEETTRLLATKFVADEAVGLVGELVEVLAAKDDVTALEWIGAMVSEYEALIEQIEAIGASVDDPDASRTVIRKVRVFVDDAKAALAKAATFTAAITPTNSREFAEVKTKIN